MPTLRSLAVFTALYLASLVCMVPGADVPGLSGAIFGVAGFLFVFPIDRVRAFYLWASESLRVVREYRTCVVTSPALMAEDPEWHYIGVIEQYR